MTRDEYNKLLKSQGSQTSYGRDTGYQGTLDFSYDPDKSGWIQTAQKFIMPTTDIFDKTSNRNASDRAISVSNLSKGMSDLNVYWDMNGSVPEDKLGFVNSLRSKLGYDPLSKDVLEYSFAQMKKANDNATNANGGNTETTGESNTTYESTGEGNNGDGNYNVTTKNNNNTTTGNNVKKSIVLKNNENVSSIPVAQSSSWFSDYNPYAIIEKNKELNKWARSRAEAGDLTTGDRLYQIGGNLANIAGVMTSATGEWIGKGTWWGREGIANIFRSKNESQGAFRGKDGGLWMNVDGRITPVERLPSGKLIIRKVGGING